MDNWITVTKPSHVRLTTNGKSSSEKHTVAKHHPYGERKLKLQLSHKLDDKQSDQWPVIQGQEGVASSRSNLTKYLLKTLSDESNPITHSNIAERSDHVSSVATGHQRAECHHNRKEYFEDRSKKLSEQQAEDKQSIGPLHNVRIYIDGYLEGTTDIEMKRIIHLAGGEVLSTSARCTHIVTSQPLNGSKTHRILKAKIKNQVHVVSPDWVMDSISEGRKKSEGKYLITKDKTNLNLLTMLKVKEG